MKALNSRFALRGFPPSAHLGLACTIWAMVAVIPTIVLAADPAGHFSPESLIGRNVDLTLSAGQTWANLKVLQVQEEAEGTVASLTVVDVATGRRGVLAASQIRQVAEPGARPCLIYDAKRKALAPPGDVPPRAEAEGEAGKTPKLVQKAKEGRARGKLWPDLTDAQQAAAVEAERAFLQQVRQTVPHVGLQLYETKRFLFFSDIPVQLVGTMLAPCLDQMYLTLCAAYGIDPETNIWKGKAIILAFANEASFQRFEALYFHHFPKAGVTMLGTAHVLGTAHLRPDGSVIISCYVPKPPPDPPPGVVEPLAVRVARHNGLMSATLSGVIVHETSHGFAYRYKSSQVLPNWLDEGIADWTAGQVVPGDRSIAKKVQDSISEVQSRGNLRGNFFTATNIEAWQYGVAVSMVDFLLKYNPKPQHKKSGVKSRSNKGGACFREFIELIKDETPWEDALRQAYGLTPAKLLPVYGKTIGVPHLRP